MSASRPIVSVCPPGVYAAFHLSDHKVHGRTQITLMTTDVPRFMTRRPLALAPGRPGVRAIRRRKRCSRG